MWTNPNIRIVMASVSLIIVSLYYYNQGIDRTLLHIYNGIVFFIFGSNLKDRKLNVFLFGVIIALTLIYEIVAHLVFSLSPLTNLNLIYILSYVSIILILIDAKKKNELKAVVSIPFVLAVTISCILSIWSILQFPN